MKTENTKTGVAATADVVTEVTRELEAVHAKMTFMPPLTPEERAGLENFGPRSADVVEKRLTAALGHRDELPPAFDLRQFERSAASVIELSKCQKALERMLVDVRDALRSLGPPVLEESKSVLGYLRVSAAGPRQVHATVNTLKLRPRAGRRSPAPAEGARTPAASATTKTEGPPEPRSSTAPATVAERAPLPANAGTTQAA